MRLTDGDIPLGVSEEYDRLEPSGDEVIIPCQGCEATFADRWRRLTEGGGVLAVFCPECRGKRRMRYAAPLPRAVIRRKP